MGPRSSNTSPVSCSSSDTRVVPLPAPPPPPLGILLPPRRVEPFVGWGRGRFIILPDSGSSAKESGATFFAGEGRGEGSSGRFEEEDCESFLSNDWKRGTGFLAEVPAEGEGFGRERGGAEKAI